jgi:hypothetical protein
MKIRMLAITLAAAALLAACGRFNEGGSSDDAIAHPTGADELVLRVSQGGGFVPVEYNLRALPGISIYGDGRMIVEGPMIEIYPGPALPNLQVRELTEDAVQAILVEARRAGLLGADAHYDYPCVADAATTTFTAVAEGSTHQVSAYALGPDEAAGDCPGVDEQARAELFEFQAKLAGLDDWLPVGSIGSEEPFTADEMRVYVLPYRGDPELEQPKVDWPLRPELDTFGEPDPNLEDIRCGVVTGEDLATLLPEARSANELTPWSSDTGEFALIFRPLLPDEHTC